MERRDHTSNTKFTDQDQSSMDIGTPSPISYEGADDSRFDPYFRISHFLPGERVRLDATTLPNTDAGRDLLNRIGEDPLTISRTIITGLEEPSPHGTLRRSKAEHEFEGLDGRFQTAMFQPELGRVQTYGILAERDGRLWLADLGASHEDHDRVSTSGTAREVVGFAGKRQHHGHPEGFDALRLQVAHAPLAGEIHYQMAVAFKDAIGPIKLMEIPWTRNPTADEIARSTTLIDITLIDEATARRMEGPGRADVGGERFAAALAAAVLVHAVLKNDGRDADRSLMRINTIDGDTYLDISVPKGRGSEIYTMPNHLAVEQAIVRAGSVQNLQIDFSTEAAAARLSSIPIEQALETLGLDRATIGLAPDQKGSGVNGPQTDRSLTSVVVVVGAAAGHVIAAAKARERE